MNNPVATGTIKYTIIGLLAIFIWGPFIPFGRLVIQQLGPLGYSSCVFSGAGCLGLIRIAVTKTKFNPTIFRHPLLYVRWVTWFLHTFLAVIAVSLISAQNLPLLILVHYTWPTMVILCSILIADVRVTRLWIFITGTVIVITSLALEILGPELFASRHNFTSHDKLAFSLSFLAAICWGVHSAVGRRYGAITGLSNVVPFFQLTYLAVLPFYLASAAPLPWQVSGSLTWWLMLFTMASFISYVSWDFGIRHGSVIVLSLCADFIPWLSLLAAHIFLQAEIGTTTVIAAVTLVIGAITTRYGTLAKKSVPVMLEEPEII